jgi:hypothetical protein
MPTHDPLSDRLTVEAMATALDLHGVDPRDDTAVVQTLQRVGYRAAVIGRLMDRSKSGHGTCARCGCTWRRA